MTEIARFYGFSISVDCHFKGEPGFLVNYEEDHITDRYSLEKGEFANGSFSQKMLRVIMEWIDDHIQLLQVMWKTKQIVYIPEWE